MANKLGSLVTYNEELPSIKSHDPLITWSLGFDFLCSSSPSPLMQLFQNIGEFEAKKYFTDHQTANKIQLYIAKRRNFSGLFFF